MIIFLKKLFNFFLLALLLFLFSLDQFDFLAIFSTLSFEISNQTKKNPATFKKF
jgi:hypothetical protein